MNRAPRSPAEKCLSARATGVVVTIKLKPRAGADRVLGVRGNALEVQVKAPPAEGRANDALIRLIARTLRRPKSDLELLRGKTGRTKLVLVRGVSIAQVAEKLPEAGHR